MRWEEVASYIHHKSIGWDGEFHIYSLPYEFGYFANLDNSFPSGMFHKVQQLEMYDRMPFEHRLFKLISQDFPFLESLCSLNIYQQKDKQHSSSTLITFRDIGYSHIDYAELFPLVKSMHLPRLSHLSMKYESFTTVTNDLTIDATDFNFAKVISLRVYQRFVCPENFHKYFPLL